MSKARFSAPHFNNDEAARKHLEAIRWPNGPVCPHCGSIGTAYARTKPGLYRCAEKECRKDFTATVGTLFERSHIPLSTWFRAVFLLCSSKKGMSSHQMHRMLGVTYKTAWFMTHRIREAMLPVNPSPLGGGGKIVESDETFIGRREGVMMKRGTAHKVAVLSLVERGGKSRSFKIDKAGRKTVHEILNKNVARDSRLMTDEAAHYGFGIDVEQHEKVIHAKGEYARGDVTTNTVEGFFSIFKRGMVGTYQHCGEQHLHRYLNEFDFRYSHREATGFDDASRAMRAVMGIEGRRLTYHQASGSRNA
ncbi:MAG: IS1595 family transposase [Alphaproteobacteria bacterium]